MKYHIIQDNQFPELPETVYKLFLDTETTSFDSTKSSVGIWRDCWLAGIAFSWDENENIYFIPLRYRDNLTVEKNNDFEETRAFIDRLLSLAQVWVNHNIKYDFHVLSREGFNVQNIALFCTLTQAKIISSDRWTYSEDALAADWLEIERVDQHKVAMKPWIEASKDWGEVPIHLMAPYACHDIHKNRLLYQYICDKMLPESYEVSGIEEKVTRCLCRTEQIGIRVNPDTLKEREYYSTARMLEILEKIKREHGYILRPNVNGDCHEIFHNKFGLPVVQTTEKGNDPSYDKFALATLKQYPGAPIDLIDDCIEYRKLVSHTGFIKAFSKHHLNGVIRCSYNQCVRTGRMACKEPNMQQNSKEEKGLIEPHEGYVFLSFDYSSIEFRILAHYLGQNEILEAYLNDPDTDFHQWVADMCQVARKPAKNINFCMAYGGGKGKVLSMLANNAEIIEELTKECGEGLSPDAFEALCRTRAENIFTRYHSVLHKLRPLTYNAANRLKARGFVRNWYGRTRQLPQKACYRALNTVIQSTAADCMKHAVVNTSPIFNERLREAGVEQVAFVHDEILFIVPKNRLEPWYFDENSIQNGVYLNNGPPNKVIQEITRSMLAGTEKFTVPIRVSAAIGMKNWANLVELPKELIYE